MTAFQLIQIGNSVGIMYPKDILTTLGVETGTPYMSLKYLTALNQNPIAPKVAAQMNASEKIMQENRNAQKKWPSKCLGLYRY